MTNWYLNWKVLWSDIYSGSRVGPNAWKGKKKDTRDGNIYLFLANCMGVFCINFDFHQGLIDIDGKLMSLYDSWSNWNRK